MKKANIVAGKAYEDQYGFYGHVCQGAANGGNVATFFAVCMECCFAI